MHDDHPIDHLIVAVEGTPSESVADAMQASARQLAGRRQWVLGPPEFVDEPGLSLGLALSLSTARPPWGDRIDPATDRAHLDEVKALLDEACRISGAHDVSFDVYFADELIGEIADGRLDKPLAVGLIGEWERVLAEQAPRQARADGVDRP